MKRVWFVLVTWCVSFTALVAIISLLNLFDVVGVLRVVEILQYFLVTLVIAVAEAVLDALLPEEYGPVRILSQIACVLAVVFVLGGLVFHWFPMRPLWLGVTAGICLAVYGCVAGVFVLQAKLDAEKINKAIQGRKQKQSAVSGEGPHG